MSTDREGMFVQWNCLFCYGRSIARLFFLRIEVSCFFMVLWIPALQIESNPTSIDEVGPTASDEKKDGDESPGRYVGAMVLFACCTSLAALKDCLMLLHTLTDPYFTIFYVKSEEKE